MSQPLLSIVIPTKNRYDCLKKFVELFHSVYTSSEIQLAISDNSDDNSDFLAFLSTVDDKRILYTYTAEHISVGENSDRAILLSTGEYVNFIGDDDADQREIIDVARFMKRYGIESLNCYRCKYVWPNLKNKVFNYGGSLTIRRSGKKLINVNIESELVHVLRSGASSYGKLPCVYNGIVKRTVLDEIYSRTGIFFPGPSPDMANAIALSLVVKKHCFLDYPVSWAGACVKSGGGMGAMHKHALPIEDASWLPAGCAENWETVLPHFWTAATVWAESAMKALRRMDREDLLRSKFCVESVYGRFLVYSFSDRQRIRSLLKNASLPKVAKAYISAWFSRFMAFWKNLTLTTIGRAGSFRMIKDINDVVECEKYIHNNYPIKIEKWT